MLFRSRIDEIKRTGKTSSMASKTIWDKKRACGVAMAYLERVGFPYGITLFGVVAAAAFFIPGWKYLRQSRRAA